jgi:glycosyltransferase involved in cell wall biosynthesis
VIATLRTGKTLPWLFRRSLQRTRHIVANSRAARDRVIAQEKLSADRISVILNALVFPESTAITSDRQRTRDRFGATADTLVLLDVAMFRPEKNQIALVDIASRLPAEIPWQLWLAGDGPSLAACRSRAAALGLTARIHFPGWLADPSSLYLAADLAVHASHRESLSNFLIEAQTHGLPAVAYDALGVSETFIPGESGILVPTDDAVAFRSALQRLAAEPSLRSQMSACARSQARENFSTTKQINAYLELFQDLRHTPSTL